MPESSNNNNITATSSNSTKINGTTTPTTTVVNTTSTTPTPTNPLATNNKLTNQQQNLNSNSGGGAGVVPQVTEKPTHYTYLKEFRVEQCTLFLQHKCTQHRPYTCFYWHFKNQRRRRPIRKRDGTFNYNPDVYCDKYDEQTGVCANGDECPYVHRNAGDTEKRYHLRYYKTATCIHETDSKGHCTKNGQHCAFAHGPNDLRPPVYDVREVQGADAATDRTNTLSSSLEKERLLNEDPKWNDTNYVLINYKTEPCRRPPRLCRQGFACPQYHNARDKRRNPSEFKYRSTPCPNVKQGDDWLEPTVCENGDNCKYCHSRTEQQFHPEIYKSSKCNDMVSTGYCPRGPFCAFAHLDNELKTQRTHSTSESSDYTLENYISNALPNKDDGIDGLSMNGNENGQNDLNDNQNSDSGSTNANSNDQQILSSPKPNENHTNNNNHEDEYNDNNNLIINSSTTTNGTTNSIPINSVSNWNTRPIGSEREGCRDNLKHKQKLTTMLDEPVYSLDNASNASTPTVTPASSIPIGSTRSLHSLQNQINSNFSQNLLTLSSNVIASSASASSPTPIAAPTNTNTNNNVNFINTNKPQNVQQQLQQQLQRSSSMNVTTPSSTTSQTVASKYSSIFSNPNEILTPNHFDFVNNSNYIDKDLNSNDEINNGLQMLSQTNQVNNIHHHSSNLIGNSSLPIQIPNPSMNLYSNANQTQNDFSNYVNINASPLNPLANTLLTQQLSQSISKPSSMDASFLVKSTQANKAPGSNPVTTQHNDLLQNQMYSTFYEPFNAQTAQTSSVPASSQSPIHHTHNENNNTAAAVAYNLEKLKQDLLKEKQTSLKLETTCNQYKLVIEKFQKETNDWKNKYLTSEHEKSQEQQKIELLKRKLDTLELPQSNNINSNNNNNTNSNISNHNLFNSTNNILNLKLYNSNNSNIKTLLPNDLDLSKTSLETLQSLYVLFKNDFNKLEKIINEKKQQRQLDN